MIEVIENTVSVDQLNNIWKEIDLLEPNIVGDADDGSSATGQKKGSGYLINNQFAPFVCPLILDVGKKFFPNGSFSVLVNKYENGDYYKAHKDDTIKTATVSLLKNENGISGGDFYFPDQDKKIDLKNNMAIIFDGAETHEVLPVKAEDNAARYSLTYFLYEEDNDYV